MTSDIQPLRDVRISVVKNGFVVVPRDARMLDGYCQDCYVFPTVEAMAAWLLKQSWVGFHD